MPAEAAGKRRWLPRRTTVSIPPQMLTAELDYPLPPELIAAHAAEPRDAARLMVIERATGRVEHRQVRDLPQILRPGDLLVFNRSRVLPARFFATRAATGGRVEGLYLESPAADRWLVLLQSGGRLQPGERLTLLPEASLLLLAAREDGPWLAQLEGQAGTLAILERIGSTPLPPYIRQRRKERGEAEVQPADAQRYNTVYAAEPGSVAAPTAGLHFTAQLLQRLAAAGIEQTSLTLHVGLGTFAPVRAERLEDHPMHEEWLHVPADALAALKAARAAGRRIIPVGTTCVRALESLPAADRLGAGGYTARTRLFLYPSEAAQAGPVFRFTDGLLTNFHLPRSTLLALVAALPAVGIERLKAWYGLAIAQRYRFYSYGDAMLLV